MEKNLSSLAMYVLAIISLKEAMEYGNSFSFMMRCSRAPDNQKMRDDYNAWRKQAQMALSKYRLGEISWEEFEKVIRSEL